MGRMIGRQCRASDRGDPLGGSRARICSFLRLPLPGILVGWPAPHFAT